MVRGLNETGGRNRLKFQKLKSRVKHARARVDVVHKVCVCVAGRRGWMGECM
jgi:hypothetical protein